MCFLIFGVNAQGQKVAEERGERQIQKYAYHDAIQTYEKAIDRGHSNAEILRNLGDSYYFNGKLDQANIWYTKLFEQGGNISKEYEYRYAQTLKSVGNYVLADRYMETFRKKYEGDSRAKLFRDNKDYLKQIESNSGRYTIANSDVNTAQSDYGSRVYDNKLIFSSARNRTGISKNIHTWTGQSFSSLYQAPINNDGSLGKAILFAKQTRTKFNESTVAFSPDGMKMYVTRNNFYKGKRGVDASHTTLLKIYSAELVDGMWTKLEELPFNSDNYSTAHPAVSADGKWLFFASDKTGGVGQSDLYKVAINPNGSYGEPQNLGNVINTEGRESFPFVTANNELYFSTDGRPGLGGLDIYVTKINADGSFSEVQNIGAPANSEFDDFAFFIDVQTKKGFLSSNRLGGMGHDDIYSFVENKSLVLECIQKLEVKVYDSKSKMPLNAASVSLFDSNSQSLAMENTKNDGSVVFEEVDCGTSFKIQAEYSDYNSVTNSVVIPNQSGTTELVVYLDKKRPEIKKGDDLFKVLKLEPIYFDYDKSDIRPDASLELAKVVQVLNEYPSMKIDVRSHTDSRGKDAYNLRLSDRRAQATKAWIIANGISVSRVTAKGYGETKLVNRCKNGVTCSDEEHQENRRSEFLVIEL